ncbi:hypothetical protein MKW94_026788 [Papaver nudicaule]|uniref:Uncharacterized protein n=1 Tax=Papaver nudicaule TaxID=74823 RepID=A0AA42AYL1_PAPNU|nr:hypothetical protein [Papaver nudicaule]
MMDAIGVCGLHVNGRKLSFEYCMTEDQRKENMERAKIRLQKKLQTGTFEENMEEDEIATLGLGPIAEELEIKIQQAPSSSDSNTTSISQEDLEELMICVKKDPYLKPIVEDIETGGPIVMMRYLDDPEVFQKLAQAMGFGDLGDNSVEHNAPNADAEAQTAK